MEIASCKLKSAVRVPDIAVSGFAAIGYHNRPYVLRGRQSTGGEACYTHGLQHLKPTCQCLVGKCQYILHRDCFESDKSQYMLFTL